MTFLPIVDRELRVAARRKSTHRIRLVTSSIAATISFFFLIFAAVLPAPATVGQPLFYTLTIYAFGLCMLAGIFITADSLSGEKREGTLGLLFLTDLKGHDVVLGKFLAMSLNAFYGLLAALPVLALPLLLGGVTGAEFWRVAVALVNALFFSLATGIWVSAQARKSHQAMGRTLLLLLLICGVPLLVDSVTRFRPTFALFSLVSPVYAYVTAYEHFYLRQSANFWCSLLISHSLGWAFLGFASWTLPRTWQDQPQRVESRPRQALVTDQRFGNSAKQNDARAKLLDINPVLWLAKNDSRMRTIIWLLTGLAVAGLLLNMIFMSGGPMVSGILSFPVTLAVLALKALFGVQACRLFVEARRNGALELLLSTPLTAKQIIDGQWLALQRIFLWPVLIVLLAQLATMAIQLFQQYVTSGSQALPAWFFNSIGVPLMFYGSLKLVADLFAVGWFGMWLALYLKNPGPVTGLTLLCVLVLPAFVFFVPDVLIDMILIAVARKKLLSGFRELATRQFTSAMVPVAPRPARDDPDAPPVIPS